MEALPLFLDRLANPLTAILVSVTAVLFFGEIIPQAICTRWAGG
jgi:metal transporter CNNM